MTEKDYSLPHGHLSPTRLAMPTPQIKTWRDIRYCEYPSPDLNDATYEAYARMFPDVTDPGLVDRIYYRVVDAITRNDL